MASFFYTTGYREILDRTIDLAADTLKLMLVTSSYTPNRDDLVVDAGGANDPVDHELNVSGYTRGYGGAGRKTLGTKAFSTDLTNDRVEFTCANFTWTALGSGQTIAAAILIKEGGANDTTSRLIAYFDVTDTPTNGGDITLTVNAEGLLQWPTV